MANFLDTISTEYGPECVKMAESIFSCFSLPIPKDEEFYESVFCNDALSKQLIFIESHGIVMRFYEPNNIPQHDFILQPLLKHESEKMHFDIVPLIKTGIDDKDCRFLNAQLDSDGIVWDDNVCHNAGYLPDLYFPHPVIIDVCDSIERLNIGHNPYALNNYCGVQKELFEVLYDAAEDIKYAECKYSAASAFLEACRNFKISRGHSDFLKDSFSRANDNGQTLKAYKSAEKYSENIRACSLA